MKLLRIGPRGSEKPALLHKDGTYRDLSQIVSDIAGPALGPSGLAAIRAADHDSLPQLDGNLRIGACVGSVGKFIGIGLNYADHAAETGSPLPAEPIVFQKATSSINGPNDDVILPRNSSKVDWEVELAIVIGTEARYVDEASALDHVAGYCVCNDISERAFQIERGGQWTKGKSADTFGPLGPWLVTTDELTDPQNLDLWLDIDGQRYQTGNTRTMVFGVRTIVSYLSQFMSLQPGDVITTGTPPGVGMGIKPAPVWLRPGQTIRLGVSMLGEQLQQARRHDSE